MMGLTDYAMPQSLEAVHELLREETVRAITVRQLALEARMGAGQ